MKGKFKKLAAAFAAVTVLVGSMPSMAFAAGSDYTAVPENAGNTAKFKKVLVVDKAARVPEVTFSYTVEAGTAVAAAAGKMPVYAGVGTPTVDAVAYSTGEAKDPSANLINDVTNHDTCTKDAVIRFEGIEFKEPGIYRYIITESATGLDSITNDVDVYLTEKTPYNSKRTLDVYVEDNSADSATATADKKLSIVDCILYDGVVTGNAPDRDGTDRATDTAWATGAYVNTVSGTGGLSPKSDNIINLYTSYDLTVAKNVTGNQGSKDKYFAITVTLAGGVAGNTYEVDLTGADATSGNNAATVVANQGKTNPATITVGAATKFYLQNGQSIVIKDVAKGTSYTVTEEPEDYSATVAVTGDTTIKDGTAIDVSGNSTVTDNSLDNNATVTFRNDRSGVLPTGIIMSVAPAAIVGLGVLAAIIAMVVAGKKRAAEEE